MRPEQISKKEGSKEAEGKAGRKKLQKIIIDVLWRIREDIAFMKEDLEIENIIAEIKNSVKS